MGRRNAIATGIAFSCALVAATLAPRATLALVENGAEQARRFVCTFTDEAMTAMSDQSVGNEQRMRRFREVFVAAFDLPTIGEIALGRHWLDASAEQQARFLALFERLQVLVFAARFDYIRQHHLTIRVADAGADGRWRVPSMVNRARARSIPVEWTVGSSQFAWQVFDLTIDGASMVFLLRADFGAVLQSHDGKFEALLAAMTKKIDQLSAI